MGGPLKISKEKIGAKQRGLDLDKLTWKNVGGLEAKAHQAYQKTMS